MKTNVGASFLKILQECFPSNHKLYKICNKNTIKISYRTMKNMKSIISIHNQKVLKKHHEQLHPSTAVEPHCNCQARFRGECPMPGQCNINDVVYRGHLPIPQVNRTTATTIGNNNKPTQDALSISRRDLGSIRDQLGY